MENIILVLLKALLVPLRFFSDPFGLLYRVKKPQTENREGRLLNFQNVQFNDLKQRVEFLFENIREKNRMHNEVVTNLRTLAITIFVAMGTFLGVILGIIATSDVKMHWTFTISAWVLLICFVIGTLATLIEWSYERNRVQQMQMYEEIGTLLLMGGDEKQAEKFLSKTIDDLEKLPAMKILAGAILPALKNLSLILSYVALIVMATGILLGWKADDRARSWHFENQHSQRYWMPNNFRGFR